MNAKPQNKIMAFLKPFLWRLWVSCLIFGWYATQIEPVRAANQASIQWLTSSFFDKPPSAQKKALRQLTLFSSDASLLFFCQVALDQLMDTDVRRDALKAILATDSAKYRAALMPLQTSGLSNQSVIDALMLLPIEGIGHAWLASIRWQKDTDSLVTQKLAQAYRSLQNIDAIDPTYMQHWDAPEAKRFLKKEVEQSKVAQEPFWLGLLAWVSTADDAALFRKKLKNPVLEIRQAAVYGLTRPGGPRDYDALVQALHKESRSRLPIKMIEYLVQDGSVQAKEAADRFAQKLPAKEKAWVQAQWR
jgi:hypothetical protein